MKQSPGSEMGQVKESGETIVLLREEHSRESPDQIKWSLLNVWGMRAVKQRASMSSNQGNPGLNTRGENCKAGR